MNPLLNPNEPDYVEINSRYFRPRFKLIIENYVDNPSFVKLSQVQCDHLLEQLIDCLEDANEDI